MTRNSGAEKEKLRVGPPSLTSEGVFLLWLYLEFVYCYVGLLRGHERVGTAMADAVYN